MRIRKQYEGDKGRIYCTNEGNNKCIQDFGDEMEEQLFIDIRITVSDKNVFEDNDHDQGNSRVEYVPVQQ